LDYDIKRCFNKTVQIMNERFTMIALLNTRNGRTNKFEEIYHAYSRYLYAIGLKILKDKDLASDALQQCFFKIYQNIDRIKDIESKQTRSFLGGIMRNESLKDESADVDGDMLDEYDRWEKEAADAKVPANTEFIILSMADEFHKIRVREGRKKYEFLYWAYIIKHIIIGIISPRLPRRTR